MNRMTCREFSEVVHGLVRLELLDVALREDALGHAARCRNCAETMSAAQILAETTAAAASSLQEQVAQSNVREALLVALRSRRRRKVWWQTFEWATAGAAVAMALVLVWSFYGRSRTPSVPAPGKDVSSHSRGPLDATGPGTSSETSPVTSPPDNVGSAAESEIASAAAGETSDGSDFVPVPYARSIEPQESGMIVRVQLTRGSLAELGYPVAGVPGEGLIRADVLVGEDGWPRAVRLVQ
jgi:hypothetical protein